MMGYELKVPVPNGGGQWGEFSVASQGGTLLALPTALWPQFNPPASPPLPQGFCRTCSLQETCSPLPCLNGQLLISCVSAQIVTLQRSIWDHPMPMFYATSPFSFLCAVT